MNRDDIIRMVRASAVEIYGPMPDEKMYDVFIGRCAKFAALVAAAEREAMIADGWRQCAQGQRTTQFCGQLEQAVLREREACAKVCDLIAINACDDRAHECGVAIRARGQE